MTKQIVLIGTMALAMSTERVCSAVAPRDASLSWKSGETWTVAYPTNALPVEGLAAKELARYVSLATGCKGRAVTEKELALPGAADAYVGATAYARSNGVYRAATVPESYAIRTQDGKLYIFGDDNGGPVSRRRDTLQGTLFGVYDFLESRLGVTWIWPGETGEYVPHHDGLTLPSLDMTGAPDFRIRWFDVCYSRQEGSETMAAATDAWVRRMRLAWVPGAWFGHSWGTHVTSKPEFKQHPEWMALWGGKRRLPHLCTSNKELRDFIVQSVLENARTRGYKIVSISPSDGAGFCECAACRALDAPGTDYTRDIPNLSNRHWDYANYIAREVKKRAPDLGVGMFAYTAYREAPTNIDRLEDNIYVSFTFSAAYFVKPDKRDEVYRQIDAWKTKGVKIVGREYWGMHYWLDLPFLFTREIADAMPYLHKRGLIAMYGETGKNYATQGPNYYLAAHLMWDTAADPNAILDRFYGAFGPARDPIRAYYQVFEDTLKANPNNIPGFGYRELLNSWPEIIPADCLERAGAQLALAKKAAAGRPDLEARVHVVDVGYSYTTVMMELLGLYRTLGRAGVPLWGFGPRGDEEEARYYGLPGNAMNPDIKAFWERTRPVTLTPDEKVRLLRRAKVLGEERARILDENKDLPAVSRGLYQFTVESGLRPWHKTVVAELRKLETPATP